MSSTFAALSLGQQALQANQHALEVVQRNIGNVNTPGYTRQRANMVPGSDCAVGVSSVTISSVDAYRDRFIDYRISQELQSQGQGDAELSALQQVEALLNESGDRGLQNSISEFFGSLSALSSAPEDLALRRQVLSMANGMAAAFRRISENLTIARTNADLGVRDTIGDINELTARVAHLNTEIAVATDKLSGAAPRLKDQRQQALEELAQLVDISYFETETGAVTVTTKQGGLLVVGDEARSLVAAPAAGGNAVLLDGADITSDIRSGKLGGILNFRDNMLPSYLASLDELAGRLMERVNAVHAAGDDYNGNVGGNFFTPYVSAGPGAYAGAAAAISVAITDPRLLAAAAAGAGAGSNSNAQALADIAGEKLYAGGTETAIDAYSSLIYRIGADTRAASENRTTQKDVLTQLQNQRDSFGGVSLDEEAISIIRYQKAYQASARFVTVIDQLTSELVQLLG